METNADQPVHPLIMVKIEKGEAEKSIFSFSKTFNIGRDDTCDIQLKNVSTSRIHADVFLENGYWWVRDLDSTNGTYENDKKIDHIQITVPKRLIFGKGGPVLVFEPSSAKAQVKTLEIPTKGSVTQYIQHYFNENSTNADGEHTMLLRAAFRRVKTQQSRKYISIIAAVCILLIVASSYALYKHRQFTRQQNLARNIFYEMKSLEVTLTRLEKAVAISGDETALAEVAKFRERRRELEQNYEQFIDELGIYNNSTHLDERLIYRMARVFGESEVDIPDGFIKEVREYINKWKSTPRLLKAIRKAQRDGFASTIAGEMVEQHMPPHFFYLALQESNFNTRACGPKTRYGIAKGMWQFIPTTASHYGLRTGPLLHIGKYDPRDERHDFEKSTRAAAEYLKDIYSTEAQASGLLVIASYNWGETKVRSLIRKMPENPRERNFWHLLKKYKTQLPKETYDYVFYIFSAAVIGENPRFFGFDFDNPLSSILETISEKPRL